MKKTILVSIGTTLATMFIVMICIHMCKSHCGQSRCEKSSTQCDSSYGGDDYHGKCAAYSGCESKRSCSSKKSCSSKSKCSKGKSCSKSKCSSTSKDGVTTKTCKYKDGEKVIIKKTVKIETEE
ncbi:MAG: hypothetical protein JKX68_03650 [Flavobacteriales bacterium]|nr:hypothetical protein [Flavobacteriales bacterium]